MKSTDLIHGVRTSVPYSDGELPPQTAAPAGAVDCHHHIFDPRFPRLQGREGVWATVGDYLMLRKRLGLSRSIVVSPGSYGFDNRALLDALGQLGDTSRGVACIEADTARSELDAMHRRGVRGIRLYLAGPMKRSAAEIEQFARLVTPLGWHIQVLADHDGTALEDIMPTLQKLSCPLVLDHLAYILQPGGLNQQRQDCVLRLLAGGNTWVKVSGLYILSHSGPPLYSDTDAIAQRLIAANPERVLWGTDWPHTLAPARKPDGAALFDRFAALTPDPSVRERILVANPEALYWA